MKRILIAGAVIIATVLSAQAAQKRHHVIHNRYSSVTYNRDSKDPHEGWHTENGFRVCHSDCDNPEIPGSGATCKDVTFMGISMRECVTKN